MFIFLLLISLLFILNGTVCSNNQSFKYCFFDDYFDTFLEPGFPIVLSLLVSSFFALFISSIIFKKWIVFAFVWLIADIIWIVNSPVNSHYYFDIGPTTKESVSVWMGFFFVFTSLAMFIVSKIENISLWKRWIYGILIFMLEVILIFALT